MSYMPHSNKKKKERKTTFKTTQAITLGNGEFPTVWCFYITGFFDKLGA